MTFEVFFQLFYNKSAVANKQWLPSLSVGINRGILERFCIYNFRYLDFVNLMSYDLHGAWENFASHSSPLTSSDPNDDLTVVSKCQILYDKKK